MAGGHRTQQQDVHTQRVHTCTHATWLETTALCNHCTSEGTVNTPMDPLTLWQQCCQPSTWVGTVAVVQRRIRVVETGSQQTLVLWMRGSGRCGQSDAHVCVWIGAAVMAATTVATRSTALLYSSDRVWAWSVHAQYKCCSVVRVRLRSTPYPQKPAHASICGACSRTQDSRTNPKNLGLSMSALHRSPQLDCRECSRARQPASQQAGCIVKHAIPVTKLRSATTPKPNTTLPAVQCVMVSCVCVLVPGTRTDREPSQPMHVMTGSSQEVTLCWQRGDSALPKSTKKCLSSWANPPDAHPTLTGCSCCNMVHAWYTHTVYTGHAAAEQLTAVHDRCHSRPGCLGSAGRAVHKTCQEP